MKRARFYLDLLQDWISDAGESVVTYISAFFAR